ncbi:MAG TPA: tRNA 2-selenouridine(34) synthase MnmH [Flavobacteriaceae bacterium]|nr:tRNA 2-selenouridine(34) synthase MnmH [Flavobacteriaceae bacterium]
MVAELSIADYFNLKQTSAVIDVRSPGEFAKGNIPGAVNIPLFSNKERAEVGTAYVQQSKEKAIELGYQFVNPKLEWFLEESRKASGRNPVVVYCWRGGMRSHAFVEHLHNHGFNDVSLIVGGYKSFRNHVLDFFEQPFNLKVLGGFTGSGKTYILKALKALGEQVIDLEGLAHHKGSAFGAIGEKPQPSVEQFEAALFSEMSMLDLTSPIWIEDESINIGKTKIPIHLYRQIRAQQVYFIDLPKEKRAKHLSLEYSSFGNDLIEDAIHAISKKLGGQNAKLAIELLEQNNYYEVALLMLKYYDKAYFRGVDSRNQENVCKIPLSDVNHQKNAETIIKIAKQHERN